MKRSILLLVVIITQIPMHAQEIGKIFTEKEADQLFGKPTKEIVLPVEDIINFASASEKVLMFNLINSKLVVLGDSRKAISTHRSISYNEPMHVFSKSKVLELLKTSKSFYVKIQLRGDILSIQYGTFVLEMAMWCPPYC